MKTCLRSSYLEIDLDRLDYNIKNIREFIGEKTKLMGVVKADGYGIGAIAVAQQGQGTFDYLGVATLIEGLELRRASIETAILILGYMEEDHLDLLIKNKLSQTIYSLDQAKKLNQAAKSLGQLAQVHIKIDTGMSRLGLQDVDESLDIIEEIYSLDHIRVEGIFTHLIDAENFDKSLCHKQYERFTRFLEKLEARGLDLGLRHILNSGGLMDLKDYSLDMVRAGIILYGLYPEQVDRTRLDLRFAASLRTSLADIKYIEKGDYVGYSKGFQADRKMRVATIPIGYADGYTEEIRSRIKPRIGGVEVDVVGNICMDQTILDISQLEDPRPGDRVTLFDYGDQDQVEIRWVASMARRLPRVYMKNKSLDHVKDYLLD